jgi:hypothetical protein
MASRAVAKDLKNRGDRWDEFAPSGIVSGRGLDMAMDKSRSRSVRGLAAVTYQAWTDRGFGLVRTWTGHGHGQVAVTNRTRTWTDRVCGHCVDAAGLERGCCVDIPGQCADMPRLLLGYCVEIARTLLAIMRIPCGCCVAITRKMRRTSRRTPREQMRVRCVDILLTMVTMVMDVVLKVVIIMMLARVFRAARWRLESSVRR